MANTTKAYLHGNGFYYIDCGMVHGNRVGYAVGDTGVVKVKGDFLDTEIAGLEEVPFDAELSGKIDNALALLTQGEQLSAFEMESVAALIIEKMEDFD